MEKSNLTRRVKKTNIYPLVGLALCVGLLILIFDAYQLHQVREKALHFSYGVSTENVKRHRGKGSRQRGNGTRQRGNGTMHRSPVVLIHGKHLKQLRIVFEILGFDVTTGEEDWDVFWTVDYPFKKTSEHVHHMEHLRPSQRVNHFPGILAIIKKARLATTLQLDAIPKAFMIPKDKDKLLAYAKKNPSVKWMQKSTSHRGIKICKIEDLDFKSYKSVIQEFVANPYLIDGRMFDISVYTIMTSLNPLRVYIVNDDTPLRFCNKGYHPFNASDVDRYVVTSDYTPIWQMPSFKDLYADKKFSFQESFNRHMINKGNNVDKIWSDMYDIIRAVFLKKQQALVSASAKYGTSKNFFELVRVDFMLDENLKVYLMEVNMSPNLHSDQFEVNNLMYWKVIRNVLRLTGIASMVENRILNRNGDAMKNTMAPDREVFVFSDWCTSTQCKQCDNMKCSMCRQCMQPHQVEEYKYAYLEHINRGACKRMFPPGMNQTDALRWDPDNDSFGLSAYNDADKNMYIWFIGMCRRNVAFCN